MNGIQSPAEQRYHELLERFQALDPDAANELADAVGTMCNEAEDLAVRRHGRQIMQMIEGSRYEPHGCDSVEYIHDEEWESDVRARIRVRSERLAGQRS